MKRRHFIAIATAAVAWPVAARAQQQKISKIGILVPANPKSFRGDFQSALRDLGYNEGQNIAFEFRSADGDPTRLRGLADDLVRRHVDVIVASLTPAATAARQATTETPIVMVSVGDPVGTGLISSLSRPGGNLTGNTSGGADISGKTVELIRDVLPDLKRVATLANAADPYSRVFIDGVEDAGRKLGIAVQTLKIRGVDDLDAAFGAMADQQAQAVIVQLSLPRKPIVDQALKLRLPLLGPSPLIAREGGLISYSPHQGDLYRRAAVYVDRILKGEKPANLPVEFPARFELIVNQATAKTLGINVPPSLLARADEVIE